MNLERTRILSPVDGYVTNLLAQLGDYVNVGANTLSLVDANSFWVDGYFEETNLAPIRVGDRAQIKLMGHNQIVRGRVDSIARAINVANAQPNNQGVATVNPIFTWVRLAQRIPVRIHIDEVPPDVILSAGMTATVEIDDRARAPATEPATNSSESAAGSYTLSHANSMQSREMTRFFSPEPAATLSSSRGPMQRIFYGFGLQVPARQRRLRRLAVQNLRSLFDRD